MSGFYGSDNDDDILNNENFTIYGGNGNDQIGNDQANFEAYGGNGNDTLYQNGDFYMDAWGGYGNDWIQVAQAVSQGSYLYGDGGNDYIVGSFANDYIEGGFDSDSLHGGDDADVIYGGDGDENVSITITSGSGAANFTISGPAGIWGDGGDDYLDGGRGDDNLYGGTGADVVLGGDGNDKLDGGTGVDRLIGGDGDDVFYVDNAADKVIEAADSGSIDRVLTKTSYALAAGQEIEVLGTTTGSGTAAINLTGNDVSQTIVGNAGVNTITGLGGKDTLQGLAGADTFVFTALADSTALSSGRDVIKDFSHAQSDKIDLHLIDANTATNGDQAFSFIGAAAFSHHAGEVRAQSYSSYTIISADVNGDAVADFTIQTNKTIFATDDFIL